MSRPWGLDTVWGLCLDSYHLRLTWYKYETFAKLSWEVIFPLVFSNTSLLLWELDFSCHKRKHFDINVEKKKPTLMFYRHLALLLQPCVLSLVSLIPSDMEDRSLSSVCLHSCSRTALWRGLQQILIVGRTVAFNSSWWPLSPAAIVFLYPVCWQSCARDQTKHLVTCL